MISESRHHALAQFLPNLSTRHLNQTQWLSRLTFSASRNDAGLAGAELALEVEKHALSTGSIDTVGTTGVFEIKPGAVNSVPREARLGIGE